MRARAGGLAERSLGFWVIGNKFLYYSYVSLTVYRNTLKLLILHRGRSPTTAAR
jgi:hypothetical protein